MLLQVFCTALWVGARPFWMRAQRTFVRVGWWLDRTWSRLLCGFLISRRTQMSLLSTEGVGVTFRQLDWGRLCGQLAFPLLPRQYDTFRHDPFTLPCTWYRSVWVAIAMATQTHLNILINLNEFGLCMRTSCIQRVCVCVCVCVCVGGGGPLQPKGLDGFHSSSVCRWLSVLGGCQVNTIRPSYRSMVP
jgi:hypothetical protein